MRILEEAVKPTNMSIEFKKDNSGLYQVFIDGHKEKGFFDEDNVADFIKLKMKFIDSFRKLLD